MFYLNAIIDLFQARKPPSYFKTLCEILQVLENFFYGDRVSLKSYLQALQVTYIIIFTEME